MTARTGATRRVAHTARDAEWRVGGSTRMHPAILSALANTANGDAAAGGRPESGHHHDYGRCRITGEMSGGWLRCVP